MSKAAREAEVARAVTKSAIRRLSLLEYLMVGAAVGLALAGGAIFAWVLDPFVGIGFRARWLAASILLLVVPAAFAFLRERRGREENGIEGARKMSRGRREARDGRR